VTAALPTAGPAARSRVTLRHRLALALVAAAVVLTIVFVGAVVALWQMLDSQDAVTDRYFTAITDAETSYTQLVDAETAVRGYALTGYDGTLEPYENAREATAPFRAVAADAATTPELRDAAAAAVASAEQWDEEFAQPTIAAVAALGSGGVSTEEVELGRDLFDQTRTAVEDYLTLLRDLRDEALAELAVWTRVVIGSLVALVLAGSVAGVVLWRTLRSWIAEPLDALGADAHAVSAGDLHHVVHPTGPGEIYQLAEAIERMRLGLVAQVQEVQEQRAEIAAAHDQLAEQAEELRRSNRDLEQFAYVASHDLQEPLRKVASFTQLLQKRYGGQMDERADQYIAFAVDGAKRMQQLIQDLLGFSRVGRLGGELADVPLEEAARDALDNLENLAEDAGARIELDGLPVVRGERPLLVQLLQNLVGNAIKFRDPARPPVVRITAQRVGDFWELECRDNGIGIDPQYAERVFVIFQRLHPKDVYEGTGIGLALCKKIVEYHGGRIWLGDADGPGTSIRWTLPAVTDPAPEASEHQDEDGPRAEGSE